MDHCQYRGAELRADDLPVTDIAARFVTPCYVYSRVTLERHWQAFSGAYGFAMSSNYNSRPRAAEVLADGDEARLVRRRESLDDLHRGESVLP